MKFRLKLRLPVWLSRFLSRIVSPLAAFSAAFLSTVLLITVARTLYINAEAVCVWTSYTTQMVVNWYDYLFPKLSVADYVFRMGFSILTTLGLLHAWFRTEAFEEYAQLFGFRMERYRQWMIKVATEHAEAVKRFEAETAAGHGMDVLPPPEGCATCGKQKAAGDERRRPRPPVFHHIPWIAHDYSKYWFGRLIACNFCLPAPLSFLVCLFAGIPVAGPAVYYVVNRIFNQSK